MHSSHDETHMDPLLERASRTLQLRADELDRRLVRLGSAVGSPWTQDEKLAALVAWLSLAGPPHPPQIGRELKGFD